MHVELVKNKRFQWYWRLVSTHNGQTLAVSETYFSKWNAKRAAKKLANANGYKVRYA